MTLGSRRRDDSECVTLISCNMSVLVTCFFFLPYDDVENCIIPIFSLSYSFLP